MYRSIVTLSAAFVLAGCGAQLRNGVSTLDTIEFEASPTDTSRYSVSYWLNGLRKQAAAATEASGGKVVFEISSDPGTDICLGVDGGAANGRRVTEGDWGLKRADRSEYHRVVAAHEAALAERESLPAADPRLLLSNALERLRTNRAFVGSACVRPEPEAAPPAPKATRCAGLAECTSDGAAICFAMNFGEAGCARASKEHKNAALDRPTGCVSWVQKLVNEKYGSSYAIRQVEPGFLEDVAQGMLEPRSVLEIAGGDDPGEPILGGMLMTLVNDAKTKRARACTANFLEIEYAPQAKWLAERDRIRAEPGVTFAACSSDVAAIPGLRVRALGPATDTSEIDRRIAGLAQRMQELRSERRSVQLCTAADLQRRATR